MAKFHGNVGFSLSTEIRPGVWKDAITERPYYGDIAKDYRKYRYVDKTITDISVSDNVSIIADSFMLENTAYIKYVVRNGTRWVVESIETAYPRLILSLGGVYNGPTPGTT